jgi:lysophospholipase L1-like esterase
MTYDFASLSYVLNLILAIMLVVTFMRYDVPKKIYDYLVKNRTPLTLNWTNTSIQRENFKYYPSSPGKIVMVGDSLVQYVEWGELTGRGDILNRGIGGETTLDVLNRIDDIINLRPRQVFLLVGVNDILRDCPAETTVANYQQIVAKLASNGIQIVCLSIIKTKNRAKNVIIDEVNQKVRLLEQGSNVSYVELNDLLTLNGFMSIKYSYDGAHLSGAGYNAIRDLIVGEMEKQF